MNFDAENNNEQEVFEETEKKLPVEETAEESVEDCCLESDETPNNKKKGKQKKTWKQELLEWVECLGIALIVVFLLTTFVGRTVHVSGPSMEPTLHNKDMLVVYHLGYTPSNGDIIVFNPKGDNKPYIKRVIAISGQTVDFKMNINPGDGTQFYDVYVDGKLLEEDYIADFIQSNPQNLTTEQYPVTVPEGHVFVLGDNRNHSVDSRNETTVGMVDNDDIVGKAIFRFWPLNNFGLLY